MRNTIGWIKKPNGLQDNYGPMCNKTEDTVNFDVDIKESLLKK